jgi:hypothetical protein
MALLTDGSPNTIGALKAHESSITEVATVEGVNVDVKMAVALEEINETLMAYLVQLGPKDPQYVARRTLGVSTVVVTPPLRRWHALLSIALIYRDAYHNQLNERYHAKWAYFFAAAADARKVLQQTGLGLVNRAVPRAPIPTVGVAAGSWPAGVYEIQIAWVDSSGQVGLPSSPTTAELPSNGVPSVTVGVAPANVTGWNVYAGALGGVLTQQNGQPLATTAAWSGTSNGPSSTGAAPGAGQQPDVYITDTQVLLRG